ncbi:MAG: cytochrome c biogenesis protein ResB [Verrucomicrobiota bacterium]|jgi:hypothetical protein
MIHRFVSIITSLRLTVVCLVAALILVFVGTLAQVDLGLYAAQAKFFRSFFVYWTPGGGRLSIPVFPGGWLIGLVLLANLLAAHVKRFRFTPRKYGILLVHSGLIFLLVGQFMTEIFQVESTMRIEVGGTKNYSEAPRRAELAVVDVTDPDKDKVVVIPESVLAKGGEIRAPDLPFALRVERYLPNSTPAGPMTGEGEKIRATQGIGRQLLFSPAPITTDMDSEDNPAALIQVVSDKGPVGDWTVSTWMTRYPEFERLQNSLGSILGNTSLTQPQSFTFGGRTWHIALRPVRYYKPYAMTLLAFHHDLYPGTDIPKNYSSNVHLHDPATGEDRDVKIFMNSPLRYRGETYYQASFEPGDRGTILQVVRNPASITPYVACSLVALGLVVQFLMHLSGFARKRAQSLEAAPPQRTSLDPVLAPARANGKRSSI